MNDHKSRRPALVAGVAFIMTALCAMQQAQAQAGAYQGVYEGVLDNAFGAGPLVVMVRPSGAAVVVSYDLSANEGTVDENVTVRNDGQFSKSSLGGNAGTSVSGQFDFNAFSGTFTSAGNSGDFSGSRKPDSGATARAAGYYEGTFEGNCGASGVAVDGTLNGIVTANTKMVLVVSGPPAFSSVNAVIRRTLSIDGDKASFGGINSGGSFFLGVIRISRAEALGSWRSDAPEDCEGTFRMTRTIAAAPRVDSDADGIPNIADNCPVDANTDQLDSNNDGVGDACEQRRLSAIIPLISSVLMDD